jgi:hypothetical protein
LSAGLPVAAGRIISKTAAASPAAGISTTTGTGNVLATRSQLLPKAGTAPLAVPHEARAAYDFRMGFT